MSGSGGRFSKDPITTGPDNLPGRLTHNFTGTGIAFLEAPVNFADTYRVRWNSGLLPISNARLTLVRERRKRLGTRRIRHKAERLSLTLMLFNLKNTDQFNFEVIVLSKESGDRHCAWSVGCKWWSIAFVERFEQQWKSIVIFYDSSSYFRLLD